MTEPTEPRSLKRTISPDLQKTVEEIQTKIPRTTGSPGDLDEEKKRWLIVGICLHSIISPLLRKYVYCIVSSLYSSLVGRNCIHMQGRSRYLCKFPATNTYFLNYGSINNNYDNWKHDDHMYDYKVMSHVDLSKLFLQPNMTHYSAIDESCDASALLGMITNISLFPPAVQTVAKKIKSDIRNKWAHCDFKDWNAAKYEDSFNSMTQLVKNVGTSSTEEHKILGELNIWATNGQNLLSGLKLGIDIVDEIRQQTHVLSEYALTLRTVTESERINLQTELNNLKNNLQERMSDVERQIMENAENIKLLNEEKKNRIEDRIPQNILGQHRQEISEWEQDQTTFFETRATRHILKCLPFHNCIVVTGSSGCGKSSNIHHAALHLRYSFGYEIIPVLTREPREIMNYYDEKIKQVFIVDDIWGKETINNEAFQTWSDYSEQLEKKFASKNDKSVSKLSCSKLLLSCRLQVYKEAQFQRTTSFTIKECNLLSPELCLRDAERMDMLHKYLSDEIIDNIQQVTKNVDYFPLLCKLSKDKTSSDDVMKLFRAPLKSIKNNIHTICKDKKNQFYALVLCILFDDGFNTVWLESGSISEWMKEKFENIVKEFENDLSKETHRNALKLGFSTLKGTYLKRIGTEYRIIHDKIYKMAAVICGHHLTECFIKYAPCESIQNHFIFKSVTGVHKSDDSIVLLEHQEVKYFERLICDLKERVITSTLHNNQLTYKTFRNKLINFFIQSDDAKTVLKKFDTRFQTRNTKYEIRNYLLNISGTTPLIESATRGYFDIVQFLIVNVKCKVNKTDDKGRSPLYKASEGGHSAVARLLLEKNADVNRCTMYGESPLYAACEKGHKDTVKLLLLNKADVNKCDAIGTYPMHAACKGRHTDIIEMLLENTADVDQCDIDGNSSLYMACKGGYAYIVKLLLQKKANVNKCNVCGISPLYVACKKGHTDVVKQMLQRKERFSQFNTDEQPIFCVASAGGHTDTVELLLQNEADVNQCDMQYKSPLYVACEGGHTDAAYLLPKKRGNFYQTASSSLYEACRWGHTDIVKLFLQNNVDVNHCNISGQSPLVVACQESQRETVKLLLQNKADINQCDVDGTSPLFAACKTRYTCILERLLQHNTDVSQYSVDGVSSLYNACKKENKDTVELLLENEANVNQCDRDGDSPLFAACRRGHKETVELLLQEKAGVNQCNSKRESPLHAVCSYHYFLQSVYSKDRVKPVLNRYIETVEILLAWNADVKMLNRNGQTPLDIARESHFVELVNLFEENLQKKESQLK